MLFDEICFELRGKPLFGDRYRRNANRVARKRVGVRVLLARTVLDVEIVFGEALDPPRDLTDWLLERSKPLQRAVICADFKLLTEDVAAEVP